MKLTTTIIRILVGLLFLLSGLVKANGPLGLSYKMQEFFEIWSGSLAEGNFFAKGPLIQTFGFLHEHTLGFSVAMITLEIFAGVALLVGWWRNAVLRLLLVLIVFFTFLTAYAFASGKFKNCGCFGDCLPITPLASLIKDVVLLVLILWLWWARKYITPLLASRQAAVLMATTLVVTLGMQWYVLHYLPFADCLPFKKGANIQTQMQVPAGAIRDSFAIRFVYEKGGKQYQFDVANLPADLATYTYVRREEALVRKGNAEAPIKGFALSGISGADSTAAILDLPQAYLLFTERLVADDVEWMGDFKNLVAKALSKGIPVYVATSAPLAQQAQLFAQHGLPQVPLFALDFTAVRTAARANPTLYHLQKGTIKEKWSYKQLQKAM